MTRFVHTKIQKKNEKKLKIKVVLFATFSRMKIEIFFPRVRDCTYPTEYIFIVSDPNLWGLTRYYRFYFKNKINFFNFLEKVTGKKMLFFNVTVDFKID